MNKHMEKQVKTFSEFLGSLSPPMRPLGNIIVPIAEEDCVCIKDTLIPANVVRWNRCMNTVSPDDPDQELCSEHLALHLHQLELNVSEALNELIRFREAQA